MFLEDRPFPTQRSVHTLAASALLWGAVLFVPAGAAQAGVQCPAPFEPAPTVPRFRSEAPGQSIWPLDDSGAVVFWPASSIPPERNSVNYSSLCDPGVFYGTERFQDVAVLEDDPDWLFVATNSGISIWDLAFSATNPRRHRMRDGFLGQIEHFPGPGEGDVYVEIIDAITSPSGHAIYAAIVGRSGHGLSVWRFLPETGDLDQIFQEAARTLRDVDLANHDGRTYVFASDPSASSGGLHVFDVSAADDLVGGTPCFDDAVPPNECTQYRGAVGDMTDGGYADLLEVDGTLYAVASDGSPAATSPLRVEIWQVNDPAEPGATPAGSSVPKYVGLSSNSRGVQLFEVGGRSFLAAIDVDLGSDLYEVRAYDVSECLDADGCASITTAWSETLPTISGNYQYLSASKSDERTFLYYGLETTPSNGSRLEQLFDVTDLPRLGSVGAEIYEITDAGAEYQDPMNGLLVDYWGDYYSNNTYGLNNILPRNGRFQGRYFYRAAVGILDVHQVNLPAPVDIFINGFESGSCGAWAVSQGGSC